MMEEVQNTLSSDNDFNAEEHFIELESDNFCVDLNVFDGPIDLLLELAKKQKVDLLEVSVLELAEQYISYIENAKRLNL